MEGRLVDINSEEGMQSELSLIVQGQRLDVSREEEANWMKFIRPAESEADQNLLLNETNGQIYFTSTRNIVPEEELKFGTLRNMPIVTAYR